MPFVHSLVHVEDIVPENMKPGEGWAISEFRLPISGRQGAGTTVFHSIFRPGSTHAKHLHRNCDEIAVYLRGHGIVGQEAETTEVRPGHCRMMPQGSRHFFYNETRDEEGLVIGFYLGAKSVEDTGYEFHGQVTPADLAAPRQRAFSSGVLVHIDDVRPLALDPSQGWGISDFRLPLGAHNGSRSALFWAKLRPGEIHHGHRFDRCEMVYYVIRGLGYAGAGEARVELRAGHSHCIGAGVEHFLANRSDHEPLEVIGVYVGAGSLEEAGYIFTGEVPAAQRRPSD